MRPCPSFLPRGILGVMALSSGVTLFGQDTGDLRKQLDEVREQNRLLQSQLQQQQRMIEQLTQQFSGLQQTNQQQLNNYQALKAQVEGTDAPRKPSLSIGNVIITGEGGVGFFASQRLAQYSTDELRIDEARLFLDAPVMQDIYFHAQLDLRTHDSSDDGSYLGELYVDFENLSRFWGVDDLVNFRMGQIYSPFGEEYQYRFAADNPLISHSLSDVWALEGGAEIYGSWKKWSYALAAQSGSLDLLKDHTSDKTVVARVGFDATPHLHLSLSGQRTGDLDAKTENLSGTWFGNLFFMPIGSANTTRYHIDIGEADARYSWKGGYVTGAGGYALYGDNDSPANNHRDIYYYYAEGVQNLWRKLYGAARFSQIYTPGGYPVMGDSREFGVRMEELWRLSLGLGYTFSEHLILKTEYTFEHGWRHNGSSRGHQDLFAIEAAFKF